MRRKIAEYIHKWTSRGYPDGIPDEAPRRLEDSNKVGTYRLICIAILKNDVALKTLGFNRTPCNLYMELKRSELIAKGKIVSELSRQLSLF
jgi:predicted phosphoadenosine phosphosulfate sulfurtransferase